MVLATNIAKILCSWLQARITQISFLSMSARRQVSLRSDFGHRIWMWNTSIVSARTGTTAASCAMACSACSFISWWWRPLHGAESPVWSFREFTADFKKFPLTKRHKGAVSNPAFLFPPTSKSVFRLESVVVVVFFLPGCGVQGSDENKTTTT